MRSVDESIDENIKISQLLISSNDIQVLKSVLK